MQHPEGFLQLRARLAPIVIVGERQGQSIRVALMSNGHQAGDRRSASLINWDVTPNSDASENPGEVQSTDSALLIHSSLHHRHRT